MSETEYSRLAEQLTGIASDVRVINEKLTGYAAFQNQVTRHDKAIAMIEQRCQGIQDSKKAKSINWGGVWGTVIGALIVAVVMAYLQIGG
jgi:hypothetical protein